MQMRISRNNRLVTGLFFTRVAAVPAWKSCLAWLGKLVLPAAVLLGGCTTAPVLPVKPMVPDIHAAPVIRKPLKIGLALGGGAARGFAHVGVIAVLEEAGLRPHLVVGTSAGSLVAAIYATGKTSAQL